MIMMELTLLFGQRLTWHAENLSVYHEYVDDAVIKITMNGSDGSGGEIERVD